MQWVMCSIYDKAAAAWLPPFCVRHQSEARRLFRNSVNGKGEVGDLISKSPDDFELFVIAMWDDSSGAITAGPPSTLGSGTEFLLK